MKQNKITPKRILTIGVDLNKTIKEAIVNGTKLIMTGKPIEFEEDALENELTGLERPLELAEVVDKYLENRNKKKKDTQANK